MLGQNYIRGCYKTSVVKEIHGFRTAYNGSQDYDLLLRYIERACWREDKAGPDLTTIEHIPLVVYHWRQAPGSVSVDINNKPYAIDAAHKAVLEHIRRTERTAFIGQHPYAPLHHLVRFLPSDPVPKASIIILTQLDRKRLDTCISSILKNTNYSNYEVVVRQVGDDPGISETMRHWVKRDPRVKHAKGGGHGGTFNFALLNNTAVDKHVADDTEVLVFLNDDTQIIETAWLGDMVGMAMRPDVGAVGVKLIYPNGQIQHNGIGIDRDAVAGEYALHLHRGAMRTDPGSLGRGALTHQVSAVTAACMAVRREVFRAVKGFNAIKFPLDYNDVDLCLRLLKAGYVNAVLSHIAVVHHEGGTKRLNPYQVNRTAMLASEYAVRCEHEDFVDPYGNPNKEHHFSGNVIKTFPPRPWKENRLPRSLVIGADKTDAHSLFIGGELPIRAEGDGPYLRLTEPTAEHGGSVDLRD